MGLHFKSLRSSSSDNCLQIWTKNSQIVIDCGFNAQWKCEELLEKHAGRLDDLDAVLVTHARTRTTSASHRSRCCRRTVFAFGHIPAS